MRHASAAALVAALLLVLAAAAAAHPHHQHSHSRSALVAAGAGGGSGGRRRLLAGTDAVRALSAEAMVRVAAQSGMEPQQVQQLLLNEPGVLLDALHGLLAYSCSFGSSVGQAGADVSAASLEPQANGQLPDDADPPAGAWDTLHSRPGSNKTFYLDFTGCKVPAENAFTGTPSQPISQAPYDSDGNPASFSAQEQAAMVSIWRAVAADFADLDVDVTTQLPPDEALFRAEPDDARYGMRVCIGGRVDIVGASDGEAGFAFVGVFNRRVSNPARSWGFQPAFVFAPQRAEGWPGQPSLVAKTVSHMLGHTLGLAHDGCTTQQERPELFEGIGDWAPIMGNPSFKRAATFDKGTYTCSNNAQQDDYATMTRPEYLTYAPADAVGETTGSALRLCVDGASACDVVGRGTVTALVRSAISSRTFTQQGYADRDLVTFTASAGIISATLAVVPPVRQSWGLFPALPDPWYRSKLNWGLEVLDANGTRVAGPVSNAWQGTAAIRFNAGDAGRGSNYFVRVSPLAVPGQPGLYGVQGAYALNVSYQAPTVPCPTTGLPICVDEQSGTPVLPPELCVTTDSQFCRALAGTTVTCKYIYKPSDFVCRQAAGLCDKPDFCSGFGGACTEDLIHPSGYVCRNDTGGGCDVEELCDGLTKECPADAFKPSSHVCRDSAGICDVAEQCTGAGADCPDDRYQPPTVMCRASAGECDVPEFCQNGVSVGSNGSQPAGSPLCPPDTFKDPATECRPSKGACDNAEKCTGLSATCPVDDVLPSFVMCRKKADECDVAEFCDGTSGACPTDARTPGCVICPRTGLPPCLNPASGTRVPVGTPCRSTATSFCYTVPGTSNKCRYSFRPSSFVCRAQSGNCDAAERCTGSTSTCPVDRPAANGTLCRASGDPCTLPALCTGISKACPAPRRQRDNTPCTLTPPATYPARNTAPRNATQQPTWLSCSRCRAGACNMTVPESTLLWCWA